MAKDVGYISYEGLPGSIHTGCVNTPAFNARFCKDHEEYVCTLQVISDDEVKSAVVEEMTSGPLTRARAKVQGATTGNFVHQWLHFFLLGLSSICSYTRLHA